MKSPRGYVWLRIVVSSLVLIGVTGCVALDENYLPMPITAPSPVKSGDIYIALDDADSMFGKSNYDLYIFDDGRVVFRRQSGDHIRQVLRKRIDRDRFTYLKAAIMSTEFFSKPDDREIATHASAAWISADFGDGPKRRLLDAGFQAAMDLSDWLLVELIIQVADVEKWINPKRQYGE